MGHILVLAWAVGARAAGTPAAIVLGLLLPLIAAAADTGGFEISRSLAAVMGAEAAQSAGHVIDPDEPISFAVFVPETYDPATAPGLLVYMSPTYSGAIPRSWERVLTAKNLIWIGANQAGNSVNVQRRALFALMAPDVIRQVYAVDAARVYVTGLSGGGKMASMMAVEYPQVFRGSIFNCGVEFWDRRPPRFEQVLENRFVFVTGEHDQALRPTRRVYRRFEQAGVPNIKLMVVAGMGHENPDAAHLEEALDFLDGGAS
jgi:dienelactone hydrolase